MLNKFTIQPFKKYAARGWFKQLETIFALENITEDYDCYVHLVAKMDVEILTKVYDYFEDGGYAQYEDLKLRILQECDQSIQTTPQNFNQVFQLQQLCSRDCLPSELLAEIRKIVEAERGNIPNDIRTIQTLFIWCLPKEISSALSTMTVSLPELVSAADEIYRKIKEATDESVPQLTASTNQSDATTTPDNDNDSTSKKQVPVGGDDDSFDFITLPVDSAADKKLQETTDATNLLEEIPNTIISASALAELGELNGALVEQLKSTASKIDEIEAQQRSTTLKVDKQLTLLQDMIVAQALPLDRIADQLEHVLSGIDESNYNATDALSELQEISIHLDSMEVKRSNCKSDDIKSGVNQLTDQVNKVLDCVEYNKKEKSIPTQLEGILDVLKDVQTQVIKFRKRPYY